MGDFAMDLLEGLYALAFLQLSRDADHLFDTCEGECGQRDWNYLWNRIRVKGQNMEDQHVNRKSLATSAFGNLLFSLGILYRLQIRHFLDNGYTLFRTSDSSYVPHTDFYAFALQGLLDYRTEDMAKEDRTKLVNQVSLKLRGGIENTAVRTASLQFLLRLLKYPRNSMQLVRVSLLWKHSG